MSLKKNELRQHLKQERLELSDAERKVKSREIVAKLKETIDWLTVKSVHHFEPIHELMEVDISDLITYLEDNFPNIQLFVPRLIGNEWEMISIKRDPAPEQFDVIIVPMLGFDPATLHRIGYGGGYYDKFLATQPDAKKIGVCFEQGKYEVQKESHDIPLDAIFTEDKVYSR